MGGTVKTVRRLSGQRPGALAATSCGFTMLEMIIAMVLLILLAFSICTLVALSQVRMCNTVNRDVAMLYAESILERARVLAWNDLEAGADADFDGYANKEAPQQPLNAGTMSQYPPSPYPRKMAGTVYPVASTGALVSHDVLYYFFVTARKSSINSNLIKLAVAVYWEEPLGGGGSRLNSRTIVSTIAKK
jgi:type II secretory pathway pseudopilin PulG